MTQTTKDEAERIEAYVATAKRITMQARQLSPSGSHAWFEWSQEQIEADIYAALRAARAEALEEAQSALDDTNIPSGVYEGTEYLPDDEAVVTHIGKRTSLYCKLHHLRALVRALAKKDAKT
jgi:hypothetical protein